MIKRLKIKFVCINMAIVTMMLLVIFGMVLHFTRANLVKQSEDMMQRMLSNQATMSTLPGLRPGNRPQEVQLPFFYVAVNVRGEVTLARSVYFDVSDAETLETILRLALDAEADTGLLPQYNLRYMKRTVPMGQTLVFVDITNELTTIRTLMRTLAGIGALALSAFLGLSVLLARWTVQPVEKAWNQQRQFVADASHELKTPLTVIMTNAELLTAPEHGEAERRQFAASILAMSQQMRGLVEGLLELARVDNGMARMEFSRMNLSKVVSDALLPFEPVYFERGLQLESQVEEGLYVQGSESHLKRVVEILLDNGLKYAQGSVTVQLRRQGGACLLQVASPGEAISREDLKNIFKRFYRIDKARTGSGSYGLGLPIAQSIVAEHGGKIWAESSGGVNTFCVQLPAN